jgi:hypothetical protein
MLGCAGGDVGAPQLSQNLALSSNWVWQVEQILIGLLPVLINDSTNAT